MRPHQPLHVLPDDHRQISFAQLLQFTWLVACGRREVPQRSGGFAPHIRIAQVLREAQLGAVLQRQRHILEQFHRQNPLWEAFPRLPKQRQVHIRAAALDGWKGWLWWCFWRYLWRGCDWLGCLWGGCLNHRWL